MAGHQSPVPPSATQGTASQRSRFNLVPRRPSQQSVQQQTGTNTSSRSSSQSTSTPKVNAASPAASGNQSNIFGKTSGWYHGANYDMGDLWKAATIKDNDTLRRCLKAGLNVNGCRWVKGDKIAGTGARSIADVVACRNDVRAMRFLLEHGVDLSGASVATFASTVRGARDALFTADEWTAVAKDPWTTPLHQACRYGHVDLVRVILDEGHADLNTRDSRKRAGLHMAVIGKNVDIAKLLLDRGATIELQDSSGVAPLAAAALSGQKQLVELFLDNGAVADAIDSRGETALYNAVLGDHTGVVRALAARGADVDLRNIDGMSAFFKAASTLKTDTMDVLTKCGAETDARDKNGCTVLIRATLARNTPLMKHLLRLGVDIDAEDRDGWTPLFAVMIHDDEPLLSLLLTQGSSIENPDAHGNTALHHAAILGSTLVVRHILALQTHHGVNHSPVNLFGETPLMLACKHNSSPIVKVLLKHGANPHHVDPNGYRALDRAMYWGSHACVRLLLEAGAGVDGKALLVLQQGKNDNPDAGFHDVILDRLQSQYPSLTLPTTATPSPHLRDLFTQTVTLDNLRARMREKQGKPAVGPMSKTASKDEKKDEESVSPDPFEACIPKPPPALIINNSTTNIKANGTNALEVGAAGAGLALGITNTVLANI